MRDILPTSWNLREHHIPANPACSLCGNGRESTLHALFLCPIIKRLWKASKWVSCVEFAKVGSTMDFVLWAWKEWDVAGYEGFIMSVWTVWNLRNNRIHVGFKPIMSLEFQIAMASLEEFQCCRARCASASAFRWSL